MEARFSRSNHKNARVSTFGQSHKGRTLNITIVSYTELTSIDLWHILTGGGNILGYRIKY